MRSSRKSDNAKGISVIYQSSDDSASIAGSIATRPPPSYAEALGITRSIGYPTYSDVLTEKWLGSDVPSSPQQLRLWRPDAYTDSSSMAQKRGPWETPRIITSAGIRGDNVSSSPCEVQVHARPVPTTGRRPDSEQQRSPSGAQSSARRPPTANVVSSSGRVVQRRPRKCRCCGSRYDDKLAWLVIPMIFCAWITCLICFLIALKERRKGNRKTLSTCFLVTLFVGCPIEVGTWLGLGIGLAVKFHALNYSDSTSLDCHSCSY